MVRLTAETKRAKLNVIWLKSQLSATPLILALQAFLIDQDAATGSGRNVISHAGAGKSTQFHDWKIGEDRQPGEFTALAQEFLEVYADAVVTITNAAASQSPPVPPDTGDQNIFNTMMADDRLQDITKTQPDFTTLLFPWR